MVKVKWNLGGLTTRKDKSTEERTENWGIQPLQFVQILKSLKYSLGNSVSDVIDNSIDIGATDIDVYFDYDFMLEYIDYLEVTNVFG